MNWIIFITLLLAHIRLTNTVNKPTKKDEKSNFEFIAQQMIVLYICKRRIDIKEVKTS